MEMEARCLIAQLIGQVHCYLLTNLSFDCWDWPLVVDAYDRSFVQTIRIPIDPSHIPFIDSRKNADSVGKGSKKG